MRFALKHVVASAVCLTMAGPLNTAALGSGVEGQQVVSGSATFSQAGQTTVIEAANNTIIEYERFNIGLDQTVQFIQPDSASRVLNRITGADVTQIDGRLLSNGIVYIVNPAGVYFGQGAVVNVGGLYAGAANLSNTDFLAGINRFTHSAGQVVNHGTIDASLVALIGKQVANYGTIHAPNGLVTMAAGDDVLISDRDRRVFVRISGANRSAEPVAEQAAVTNAGHIKAQKVVWGAGDIYAMGIHQQAGGATIAKQVEVAATDSNVHIQGTIDASSSNGVGGEVTVTGKQIRVDGTIDTSGDAGGGTIRIGGDVQGSGDLPRAQSTAITDSAHLIASAITQGDGGTIIVWSDGSTWFTGTADARGGATGGDGGFIETSGKALLWVSGASVIASALEGTGGQWLLDPTDVTVSAAATSGMVESPGGSGNFVPIGDPATANINTADITNALDNGTSVTITTTSGGAAPNGGRIEINDTVLKSAGGDASFTLNADENIEVNFAITATVGMLDVILDAGGSTTISAPITTNGGMVDIDSVGDVMLSAGAIDAGAGNVDILVLGGGIDEIGNDQLVEITTSGLVTLATGNFGIGNLAGASVNADSTPLLDIDAGSLNAEVVLSGDMYIKSHAAGGTVIQNATAGNGFVRLDTVGPMILADNAVSVSNTTPGAGFVWLVSESTITQQNPGAVVSVTAGDSATVRVDTVGDIGSLADPLDVDASGLWILVGQGTFGQPAGGSGGAFFNNVRNESLDIRNLAIADGNAAITSPLNIVVSPEDGFGNVFTMTGTGELTLTSAGGAILPQPNAGISANPDINVNGKVTLNAATNIATAGQPQVINGVTELDVTGPDGIFITGDGATNVTVNDFTFIDVDPTVFTGVVLGNFPNFALNITSDGTDVTITEVTSAVPYQVDLNTIANDIIVAADAIDIAQASTDDMVMIEADSGSVSLASDAIDAGAGTVVIIADADESNSGAITASGAAPHITAARAELTSGTAIGTMANPVELASATQVVLNANEGVFVDHDGATDVTLFSLSVRPDGAFSYLFNGFLNETMSGDANAIIQDGSGNLNINNAQTVGGTSYAFTAKSGDVYIDDDGMAVASPIIGNAGDGGISSGTGNVTVTASAGSVLPELARGDKNIRTSVNDTSVVTLRALNPNRAGGFEASIGGDGTGDNFIDIANARNIVVDARDHMNIRGMGQSLLLFDMTVDAGGPNVPGAVPPTYSAPMFDDGTAGADAVASGGLTSDGTDLFINDVDSEIATDFRFTTYSGDIDVTQLESNGGPITLTTLQEIVGSGDVRIGMGAIKSFGGTVTVQATAADDGANGLMAPTGSPGISTADILIDVNGIDATVAGNVNLFSADQIDETDADDTLQQVNITANVLTMRAQGDIGDAASVSDETAPTHSHLDIDVVRLDALVTSASNNIIVKDQGADGFTLARGSVNNGFVRIDSVGTMTVEDGAAFSGGSFVWLASEADIVEQPGDNPLVANAMAGGNVRFDAEGNIGAPGDPFDVFSAGLFALVGQGAFGGTAGAAGDIHVINLRTDLGNFDVFQLQVFNGDITVQTDGDMTIDGFPFFADNRDPNFEPFDMDNPGDITFTVTGGGTINVQNADLDNPSGFDNFNNLVFNGPVVIDVNQQFPGVNFPFQNQATTALLDGGSVTFNDTLTALVPFTANLAGNMTVVGAADFQGSSTLTGMAIDFQNTVSLAGQQFVTGSTVSYASTISSVGGAQSLFVDTTGGGTTRFGGQVGTNADPFFQINTNADGKTIIAADVHTAGRQGYFDHVELAGDVTLTDLGSLFGSGVFFTSVGSDGTPRGLTVVTETDAANFAATLPQLPLIGFAGSVGVDETGAESAGTHLLYLRLNPGATRTAVPAVATVAVGNRVDPTLTDTDPTMPIAFSAYIDQDFAMGQSEKMTVVGDANFMVNLDGSLNAATAATLSDINANGLLTFDANGSDIVLLSRVPMAGEQILEPSDSNLNTALDDFQPDRGLDFWGRDGLLFNNANSMSVSGAGSARFFTANLGNVAGLGAFSVQSGEPFPEIVRLNGSAYIVLDLIPVPGDPGLGTVFASGPMPIDDRIRLPLTTTEFTDLLQILTRDPQAAELMARLGGSAVYDDSASGAGRQPVALQRVREYVVPKIIDSYRALFYEAVTDASGQTFYEPRFDQLRQTLAEGVRVYREATGQEPDDAKLFRTFFEQTQLHPETLAVLNALRQFYREMGQLGLTDREWSFALYAIARPITPRGIGSDLLNLAALGQ